MNPLQVIATLRKFGNYIAGVFPFVADFVDSLNRRLFRIVRYLRTNRKWRRFARSPRARVASKIVERFYWKNYAKDRINLKESPPDSLVVLRPIFQLCILLCLLIPLTQYPIGMVALETFAGFQGKAPLWSIFLWLLCLPCSWAALLVGTAFSNRIAFATAAAGAAYYLTTCVVLLPRSYFNGLLTVALLLALYVCERVHFGTSKRDRILGVATALVAGGAAGFHFFILTPLKPLVATVLVMNTPPLTIAYATIFGAAIGLGCYSLARLPSVKLPLLFHKEEVHMGRSVWTVATLLFLYLISATLRGSPATEAGMMVSSISLTNNYLWPIWYFVGVGIIHKLIGSSKAVTHALEGTLPEKAVIPILLPMLVLLTLACISDTVLSQDTNSPILQYCFPFFAWIYQTSKPWLWSKPLDSIATHWLSKVLLADVVVVAILVAQRKLTNERLLQLFYLTSLASLLIWEYLFQISSFARTPQHSVVVLFFFAVWLLWLMHTVGWSMCIKSSPAWPARGRLAVYAGIVTLALTEIHARAACGDFKVVNELFLTLFRGAIDIGLPYFFYTWAAKKLPALPATPKAMLGAFILGAVSSLGFNILDKLSATNWSFELFNAVVQTQAKNLLTIGSINTNLQIPNYGLLLQSLVYISLILLTTYTARRTMGASITSSRATVFILMAFASGVASFSRTLVELPVSPAIRALTAPLMQETQFNSNVFITYLAFWVPALVIGIAQLCGTSWRRGFLWLAAASAIAFNWLTFQLYHEMEPLLRATGSLYSAVTMVGGLFVLLVLATMKFLSDAPPEISREGSNLVPGSGSDSLSVSVPDSLSVSVPDSLSVSVPDSLSSAPDSLPVPDLVSVSKSGSGTDEAAKSNAPLVHSKQDPAAILISARTVAALILVLEVGLGALILQQTHQQFLLRTTDVFSHQVLIQRDWKEVNQPGTASGANSTKLSALFKRANSFGEISFLQMGSLPSNPAGTLAQMKQILVKAAESKVFVNLSAEKIVSWDRYCPQSLVCDFSYELPSGKKMAKMSGVSVLVPTDAGKTEYYTAYCHPSDMENTQWELALLIQTVKQQRSFTRWQGK